MLKISLDTVDETRVQQVQAGIRSLKGLRESNLGPMDALKETEATVV